jgi:isoleucyl-tRNA synthetase
MAESIHLNPFPESEKRFESPVLIEEMELVKDLAQNVLALREEKKLRLRWPLNELVVESKEGKVKHLTAALAKMCNVKKVIVMDKTPKGSYAVKEARAIKLHLKTEAGQALKEEWELRELVRRIQSKRKEARLNPLNVAQLWINCSDPEFLEKFKKEIEQETNTMLSVKEGRMERLLNKDFFIEIKK